MRRPTIRVVTGALTIMALLLPGRLVPTSAGADVVAGCPKRANSVCPMQDNVSVNAEVGALVEGRTAERTVWARVRWNPLGILVGPEESYQITWSEEQTWCDCTIPSSPAGYTSYDAIRRYGASRWAFNSFFEFRRRVAAANWFALVCGVNDRSESYRAVEPPKVWSTLSGEAWDNSIGWKTGQLGCFANDIGPKPFYLLFRDFYENNSGSIRITVTRVRPE